MKARRLVGRTAAQAALTALAALVLAILVGACSRHEAPSLLPPPPPLPATPARLLATGSLAHPDASWTDVQKQIGVLGTFLPATFAGAVGSAFDLDGELTALVDGAAPLYFAAQADEIRLGTSPSVPPLHWALALPVKDVARVAAMVDARRDGGAVDADAAAVIGRVAAAPRYLLVASDDDAVAGLGPYVTRVLPEAPRPEGPLAARALLVDVPHDALAGPLSALLSSRWREARMELAEQAARTRQHHGGRAPDFADPDAVLQLVDAVVAQSCAFLADLDHASIRIDLGGQHDGAADLVSAQVTFTRAAGGAVAAAWTRGLTACDLDPLEAVSLDAPAALLACSDAAGRASFASTLGAGLRAGLGSRLSAADGDRLQKALDDLARARGDWLVGALAVGGGVRLDTVLASSGVAAPARQAVRSLVEAAHAPGFAEPLAADFGLRVRPPTESTAVLERVGAPAAVRPGSSWSVTWRTDASEAAAAAPRMTVAAGPDAPSLFAPPTRAFAEDARLSALLAGLGRPTFALVVQPQMAGSAVADARPHAGIAAALGTTGGPVPDAYLRLVADPDLARSLVRLAAGF